MIRDLRGARRIVIKTGSALVTTPDGATRAAWLGQLASDIKRLKDRGQEVIWVSSGAVALGRPFLPSADNLNQKQAAAALGQPRLMAAITEAFLPHGLQAAQALLTLGDTENRRRWLNARATLTTLLASGAIPLINENDTVATDEIRYGDNDRLAARVAQMVSADVLVLLSDVDGLYTADPRRDPDAEHIPELTSLSTDVLAMAGTANATAGVGSGGMVTKLAAAEIAHRAGCATVITLGDRPQPIGAIEAGERASWILPNETPVSARQAWLRGHLTPEGELTVDAGAADAIQKGASLLPVGVVNVIGRFDKGAPLSLRGPDGRLLGKGLSAYGSSDIDRIKGLQSEETATVLGYAGRPAIIHRDDLVLETE